jgi:hypothetical protein
MGLQIDRLNLNLDELRTYVLKALKKSPKTQYLNLCNELAELLVREGIAPNPKPTASFGYHDLNSYDEDRVREILWDLVIERIVTIGMDSANAAWPFLKLTEYGLKVLESSAPIPHDPSGYLARIRQEIPQIDTVIYTYLVESIQTYNIQALLSTTVTLGCASEKALLLLINAYKNAIQDGARKASFMSKTEEKLIKRQFDEFRKCITNLYGNMPGDIVDDLDNSLIGVFSMIRNFRNDAGHPTGKSISRDQAFANLHVFIQYCKKVYQLIEYFNTNPII